MTLQLRVKQEESILFVLPFLTCMLLTAFRDLGAVLDSDPMLVMEYMDNGSLYDLLHNETMIMEPEIILPMLRDISQGLRFLHATKPPVIHGDLKSANVLVDSKFRAKVADFGLSFKGHLGTGTVSLIFSSSGILCNAERYSELIGNVILALIYGT